MIENTNKAAAQVAVDNTMVLGTVVQLGVDVLRELSEGGGLGVESVKGEEVTVVGVRNLLVATIGNEFSKGNAGRVK